MVMVRKCHFFPEACHHPAPTLGGPQGIIESHVEVKGREKPRGPLKGCNSSLGKLFEFTFLPQQGPGRVLVQGARHLLKLKQRM